MKREYTLADAMQPPFCPGVGYSPQCRLAGSCGRDYKRNGVSSVVYSRKIPTLFVALPRVAHRTPNYLNDLAEVKL